MSAKRCACHVNRWQSSPFEIWASFDKGIQGLNWDVLLGRADSKKQSKALKYYEITSVQYFNFSLSGILLCPNSLHVLPSTMIYLSAPARALYLHVKVCILKLQLLPDSLWGFCFMFSSTNCSCMKPGEKPESIWMLFYGPFKITLNIASIKALQSMRKIMALKNCEGKMGLVLRNFKASLCLWRIGPIILPRVSLKSGVRICESTGSLQNCCLKSSVINYSHSKEKI